MSSANCFNLKQSKILSSGRVKLLTRYRILYLSKLLADDEINVIEKLKLILERVKNIVGKGENAGYQHFLLFPQFFFQRASFSGSIKVGIMW